MKFSLLRTHHTMYMKMFANIYISVYLTQTNPKHKQLIELNCFGCISRFSSFTDVYIDIDISGVNLYICIMLNIMSRD